MKTETITLKSNEHVTLTTYILDGSPELSNITSRPSVIIFPGGGYRFTSDREAEPVAMAYLAEGYNAFVLRYSVQERSEFPAPLNDAEEAMSIIKKNHQEWNVDPSKIAVIGFSAGGHLATALSTMGQNRPNALILGYPCILSTLGGIMPFPIPSLEKEVDEKTPPTFLFTTYEDDTVPMEHAISFMQALHEHQIPFESHIFQKGAHGLSLGKSHTSSGLKPYVNPHFSRWMEMSVTWLRQIFGDYDASKETLVPEAREMKQYNIDVMLKDLFTHSDCLAVIAEYLPVLENSTVQERTELYSIRFVNPWLPSPCSDSQLEELDSRLKKIPFKEPADGN